MGQKQTSQKKILGIFSFLIAFLLIFSPFVAASWWDTLTGHFTNPVNKQRIEPLRILPSPNQDSPLMVFKPQESKEFKSQSIKFGGFSKLAAKEITLRKTTIHAKIPLANICINAECRDYALDEKVELAGIRYDLALIGNNLHLIRERPMPHPDNEILPAGEEKFSFPITESGTFEVGFVIDRSDYPSVTESDLLAALAIANAKIELHGAEFEFALHGIRDLPFAFGADPYNTPYSDIILDYFLQNINNPPNGVVILRKDEDSGSFGGYAVHSPNLLPYGYTNRFVSPYFGSSFLYGSVIDYDHIYSACGYNSDGEHISRISILREDGSAECLGIIGVPCVFYNGAYRCSNVDLENSEYAQPYAFFANNIVHEFLHSFHPLTESIGLFHYCAADCPLEPCSNNQGFSGICPVVWNNFMDSSRGCSNIPPAETAGQPCNEDCECGQYQGCLPAVTGNRCAPRECNNAWSEWDCGAGSICEDGVCIAQKEVPKEQNRIPKILKKVYYFFRKA